LNSKTCKIGLNSDWRAKQIIEKREKEFDQKK
jgi:hypothetical protein